MEALSTFRDLGKQDNRRADFLRGQIIQARRNLASANAASLVNHLEQAQIDADALLVQFEERFFRPFEILASTAELIHPSPEILLANRADVLIDDPTDNLILASVLFHAKNYPAETKVFLTENRKDFDINTKAKLALREAGVRFFSDASQCLEWHRALPGS